MSGKRRGRKPKRPEDKLQSIHVCVPQDHIVRMKQIGGDRSAFVRKVLTEYFQALDAA